MRGHAVAQIGGILTSAMMVPMQAEGPSEFQRQEQPQPSVASLKACMRTCDGEKKQRLRFRFSSRISYDINGARAELALAKELA